MFCIYCGSEIPDDSTFCPNCGATLPNEDTSTSNSNEELDDATRAFNSLAETWDNSAEQHADNELDSAIEDHTQVRFNPVVPGTTPRMGQVVPAGQNPYHKSAQAPAAGPNGPVPHRNFLPLAIILGILAVALLGVAIALGMGIIGPRAQPTETPVLKEATPITPLNKNDESETENESGSVEGVPVREDLADYSWQELSLLGQAIGGASDDAQGEKIAQEYGLLESDGSLPHNASKQLELTDGTSISVRIAGIRHDTAQNGSPAGITFIASSSLGDAVMNSTLTSDGGWSDSALRSSLQNDVINRFPSELKNSVVAVEKHTNNAGKTNSTSSVNITYDTVWLPSLVEVGGTIPRSNYEADATYVADILNAEGKQYQLFSELGANQDGPSDVLSIPNTPEGWWLRSASPRRAGRFMTVDASGTPGYGRDANESAGCVFGFCL